jgi:hypothetical protein
MTQNYEMLNNWLLSEGNHMITKTNDVLQYISCANTFFRELFINGQKDEIWAQVLMVNPHT